MELERKRLNKLFWEFSYEAQGLFVKSLVTEKEVYRRINLLTEQDVEMRQA